MTKIQFFQFLVFHLLCGLSAKISVRPDKIQSAEIRHVSSRKNMNTIFYGLYNMAILYGHYYIGPYINWAR